MRFALFALFLSVAIRGDSSYQKDRDVLECLSEMDAECISQALRRGRAEDLMPRLGDPPGKDVTLEKIAGSDLMDSYGNAPDRFHFDDEKVLERGDHTGIVMIPLIFGLKLLGLMGVTAMAHFLFKAIFIAKMSLIVSVWLIYRAVSRTLQKYKDLLPSSPNQYPKNEPDLSGYGYMSPGGYQYNEEELVMAALNKTLMSWPNTKWRIVSSNS